MKTYFKIFLLSLSLFIMSCSDDMFTYNVDDETETQPTNEDDSEKNTDPIIQEITGAGDCLTNKGWSWSNYEAVTINKTDTCEFSFKTTVAGELSFYHSSGNDYRYSVSSDAFLEVVINDKTYFKKGTGSSGSASIGSVKANEVVIFRGRDYRVKNIKITEDSK